MFHTASVMKTLTVFCAIAISAVFSTNEEECEGVDVRGIFHKKEILGKGLNRPYQLAYYKHKHELFFSQNVGSDKEDRFEIARLLVNSSEHKVLSDIENGFAIALNEKEHVAYFGGSEGIYKTHILKNDTNSTTKILDKHNIWNLFYNENLYFITFPAQHLYLFEKGKAERKTWPNSEIYQFAIDGDDDVFITNKTGLFMTKKRSIPHGKWHFFEGETVFRAIGVNSKGEAHLCGRHGIYVPIKSNHTLHQIANIKNVFGITFDNNDHIIYSNPHQIVKLMPSLCYLSMKKIPFVPIPVPAVHNH